MPFLAKLINWRDYFKAHPPVPKAVVEVKPQTRPSPTYPLHLLEPDYSMAVPNFPHDVGQDRMFLQRMEMQYRQDLRALPGAHQLYFDLLCDTFGKTYWENGDNGFRDKINWLINDTQQFGPPQWDLKSYNGVLRSIYDNLVAAKLGR